ncbi:hypothetical protein [Candidatus Darwinibacter acetoxidans]
MIKIAGVKVASPADVKIGRFDLTKSNRTASGKMTMEIIRAGVRRVDVSWSYLPDDQLKQILDVLAANKPFFSFRYLDAGGYKTMTAYAGDIITGLWHEINGIRYWKEVQIAFIEQ